MQMNNCNVLNETPVKALGQLKKMIEKQAGQNIWLFFFF